MLTHIEISDKLMATAMRLAKTRTKKETIALALEALIRSVKRKELLSLKGRVTWEGDLDEMRGG